MTRNGLAWLCCFLVGGATAIPTVAAQTSIDVVREGWHVVRPGETLWALAERYLGSEESWPILHALNPEIVDPHRIRPGERVRVQVTGDYVTDVAQVTKVSRRVEGQLTPHPWRPSIELDLLNPFDGVRTFEASSSELLFADASRLVLSEDSLVFLGRGGSYQRRVRRDEIEIIVGQADLEAGAEARRRDVILGAGRMQPAAGEGGVAQARLRRPADGGAQIMIYEGEGAVESGGATQLVERGMGTQMREGEAPSPPEALLPAPAPESPAAASEWYRVDPPFTWEPVAGAAGYVVEICRDPVCGRLVERRVLAAVSGLDTVSLETGEYHWRVTAVSASGLDGYPSAATPFAIVSATADGEAPEISARFEGPRVEHDGTLYVGPGARLEVEVTDAASGVETSLEAVTADWGEGPHALVLRAIDRAGNAAASDELRFVRDTLPPEIHLGPEGGGLYHSFSGESSASAVVERGARSARLRWSDDLESWQAVDTANQRVERREAPRFFLRRRGRKLRVVPLPGVSMAIGRREGLGVLATDAGAGAEAVEFRLLTADGVRLVVESVDRLGNRSRVEWPLARGRKRR